MAKRPDKHVPGGQEVNVSGAQGRNRMARPGLKKVFFPEKENIREAEHQGFLLTNTSGMSKSGNKELYGGRKTGITLRGTWGVAQVHT